jgi:signal transduction histidine kinase
MKVFSLTEEELLSRLNWFVKLRWLFLLGLGGVLFFAIKVFKLEMELAPIVLIAVIVLVYNSGFFFLQKVVREKWSREATVRGLRIEANLQIGLDLLALVLLIHFSGGIENPFIFFFIFHVIMGSILLIGRDIWIQAGLALGILLLLLALSYFRIITHYRILGFGSDQLWTNVPYIWAGIVAFSATIFITVYMTNSISRSLRKRESELLFTKNQLEKKSRELEFLNQELISKQNLLIQSEKMASLGKLSAGVAHELNSPMTGILSFAHFIKDSCPNQQQLQHDIEVIIRETERCKKIVRSLLDFARQSKPEKKEDDVIQLLNRIISLIENHKDFKNIKIIREFDQKIPLIMFDKDQLQQVFMNLVINAQEAMPSGGTLYISAGVTQDGDYIEIKFLDTGTGIEKDNMGKIFDPYFTTKEMGSGIGLSISLGIIESHGGKLEVVSSPGDGSTFIVKLPVARSNQTGDR